MLTPVANGKVMGRRKVFFLIFNKLLRKIINNDKVKRRRPAAVI